MLALGGPVRVAPYATFGTPELAKSVLDALEGRTRGAARQPRHGDLRRRHRGRGAASELLEWAALVYWRAAAIGTPRTLGPDALTAVADAMAVRRRSSQA